MNIYDKIILICSKNNISLSKLCLDIGLSKNTGYNWKNGSIPSKAVLFEIADYFHVSIDYFNEDNEDVIRQAQFENDMKMELFGTIDVPQDVFEEVKDFSVFLLDRYNSKKENNA